MSNEVQFVDGMTVKAPNEGAPDYVKAKGWIRRDEMIAWLQAQPEDSINYEVKESKAGKWYCAVDSWKPNQGNTSSSGSRGGAPQRERPGTATSAPPDDFKSDDIPFIASRGQF